MIKRTYLLTILLIVCLLTGCGNKTEKMCRIEIRNENNTDVITLEQQSQADVVDFFDEDEWTECENFDEKLVSEYVIELYLDLSQYLGHKKLNFFPLPKSKEKCFLSC